MEKMVNVLTEAGPVTAAKYYATDKDASLRERSNRRHRDAITHPASGRSRERLLTGNDIGRSRATISHSASSPKAAAHRQRQATSGNKVVDLGEA
jgi:hypothetical protein